MCLEMGIKDKPLERRESSESERGKSEGMVTTELLELVELDGELSVDGGVSDRCGRLRVRKNSKQLALFNGSEMVVELTVESL